MCEKPGRDEREHGVAGGQQDLSLGLEWFGFQAVLQRWAALLSRDFDVMVTGGVQSFGVPAQSAGFLHRALNIVAERAGPIHRKVCAQLMTDLDVIPDPNL